MKLAEGVILPGALRMRAHKVGNLKFTMREMRGGNPSTVKKSYEVSFLH